MSPKEIREALELDTTESISNRHWSIMPCSAHTGQGLLEGIDWIVNDIKTRIFMME